MSLQKVAYGFIPTSITGCVLWMDAADSSTITLSSTAITQWNDKSASANHFVQATTANSPTVGTSANGLPTIYFATDNKQLVSSQNNATSGNASRTVIQVFWCPTLSSAYYSVTGTESGANPAQAWGHAKNANSDVTYPFMYSSVGNDVYTFVYSTPNPLITYAQYDSTASSLNAYYATSGATGGTTTVGNFTTKSCTCNTTAGVWYLGRRQQAATGSITSHLLEMIHFNKVLSTTERQQVEGYLIQKWDLNSLLPATHPGRSTTLYRSDYKKQNVMTARPFYTAFSPRQISGCILWLDAADASSVTTSGTTVTAITDKSARATVLTSPAGFTYPNNTFNGSYPSFYNTSASGGRLGYNTTYSLGSQNTVFIVGQLTSPSVGNQFFDFIDGYTSSSRFFLFSSPNFLNNYVYGTNGSSSGQVDGAITTAQMTSPFFWSVAFDTSTTISSTLQYVNGTQLVQSPSTLGAAISSYTGIIIGQRYTQSSESVVGHICEFIIFDNVLTATQRQQVESYLAQKWGLTASLPGGHSHATQPAGAVTRTALTNFRMAAQPRVLATGGTVTISGVFKIHRFTSVGTTNFVLTSPSSITAQVLVVAGGGAGGTDDGGGGGAGGVIYNAAFTITSGTYGVVVGNGGTSNGANGENSVLSSLTAIGGGGGANSAGNGGNGGSGGGIGWGSGISGRTPGSGTADQGFAGGGGTSGPNYCAGGGGGAGGVGGTGSGITPGNGGIGVSRTIAGTTYNVGGGGGGGLAFQNSSGTNSTASFGGGNGAGQGANAAVAGTTNTGGGGGGANNAQATTGGFGGTGIVIIAYLI